MLWSHQAASLHTKIGRLGAGVTRDEYIRETIRDLPAPTFEDPAFTKPPALEKSTVAIVTTAGLHHSTDDNWSTGRNEGDGPYWRADQSFRVIDGSRRDIVLSHWSPNFDRSGFVSDLNVVFPIDRLEQMANAGAIGEVAPRHLSFVGAQGETLSTIRLDTGPAASQLLLEDGVDVVLLTPV